VTTETPCDMDDPAYLAGRKWGAAIERWVDGNGEAVGALLMASSDPIPGFAREFLADLATGRASRRNGRPPQSGRTERAIVFEVFVEWEKAIKKSAITKNGQRTDTPKNEAIRVVDENRKTSTGATVEKLHKLGITLEWWQAHGRPDWSKP